MKIITSKIVNGKKMFLIDDENYQDGGVIEDNQGQWKYPGQITKINSNNITMKGVPYPVYGVSDVGDKQMMYPNGEYKFKGNSVTEYPILAQAGTTVKINKENISNYNPYYVDVKGLNASESTKTNLTPATKITPQEIKKIKESPTNVGNIKIKEAQEKAQRLKEAEEAYKKRKTGAPITPELLAQETQAIGDKISLQNIPGVGKHIPEILDVTGMIGNMASGLGRNPLNVEKGDYGQAALSIATPLTVGALAGIGTQNTGQFVNNLVNPLANINPFNDLKDFIKNANVYKHVGEDAKLSLNGVGGNNPYLHNKKQIRLSDFENDVNELLQQGLGIKKINNNLSVKLQKNLFKIHIKT